MTTVSETAAFLPCLKKTGMSHYLAAMMLNLMMKA
jgi:hypothetical protein